MIARVSLEIALRKEFDYLIPPGLIGQVDVGSRVQVPFGPRKVMGCVTALAEESAHTNLKPIIKIIGAQKTYETKTDKGGVFEIYDLPPGKYSIEPEMPAGWKIDQYHLSVTVPNDAIRSFIKLIDDFKAQHKADSVARK